jgi:hypothetical protein
LNYALKAKPGLNAPRLGKQQDWEAEQQDWEAEQQEGRKREPARPGRARLQVVPKRLVFLYGFSPLRSG